MQSLLPASSHEGNVGSDHVLSFVHTAWSTPCKSKPFLHVNLITSPISKESWPILSPSEMMINSGDKVFGVMHRGSGMDNGNLCKDISQSFLLNHSSLSKPWVQIKRREKYYIEINQRNVCFYYY